MDIGTGIFVASVWYFAAHLGSSEHTSELGKWFSITLAILASLVSILPPQ